MRKALEVESVVESSNRIKVGIIVHRGFQPPVTIVFQQEWGGEIEYVATIIRADGSGMDALDLSSGWKKSAKALAETIIRGREKRRKEKLSKKLFWETQPRLFD